MNIINRQVVDEGGGSALTLRKREKESVSHQKKISV